MSTSPAQRIRRRHLIAIATSEYDDPRLAPLPGVPDEVAALRDWLCDPDLEERVSVELHPELASNPTREQVRSTLEDFALSWTANDAVVVLVTGHGLDQDGSHWVAVKATDPGRPLTTAIRTGDLVGWLAETDVDHLVVIIDLCFAGAAAVDTLRLDRDFKSTWLMLASATRNETASTGALTAAITAFLGELNTREGARFNHGEFLRVDEFLEAIQDRLPPDQHLAHLQAVIPTLAVTSPCLPNPRYRVDAETQVQTPRRDLAIRPADLAAHWGPRSRGVTEVSDPGWLFTGRIDLMRRLIDFTTASPHNMVVTGGAGCGKSAVLARLVTLADPEFTATFAAQLESVPEQLRPKVGCVDVAVLATGKLSHEVLGQICAALDVPQPGTDSAPSLTTIRQAWWTWLAQRQVPVTIVVDALDEAVHPHTMLTEVLAQLNPPTATTPAVRLLVGVRSPSGPEQSSAASDPRVLADAAETELAAVRLRTDETPWWQPGDLTDYVRDVLTNTGDSPYPEALAATREHVADEIATRSGRSYLFARVAAASLVHRTAIMDVDDPDWQAALDDGVVGVFRDDLHTTVPNPDDREKAVHLLRAVAFAHGRGLPWHRIWPLVANAVADDPEHTYGDSDIAWLLDSRLAAYLITDNEDDTTVYRPFHDVLRTTLRDRWSDFLTRETAIGSQKGNNAHAIEARIAAALSGLATPHRIGGIDLAPPTYIRRHLVEHAHAGGVLNDQTIPTAFLPYLDPGRLRQLTETAPDANAASSTLKHLPAIRRASHIWDWRQPSFNAAALSMEAALVGTPIGSPVPDGGWNVHWASASADSSEVVGRHAGRVFAAAPGALPDGRIAAVTGGDDGMVLMWDLTAGSPIGRPVPVRPETVATAVATAVLPDRRTVAVIGGADANVRVMDMTTGASVGEVMTGHIGAVWTLATTTLSDGRAVAISGGADATLRVWDLTTGVPIGEPMTGHSGAVWALATTTLPDGRTVAVSSGADATLRVWDLNTGTAIGTPMTGHTGPVWALATTTLPSGRGVAVTGGDDSTVRVWDIAAGALIGAPMTGHTAAVRAVAIARLPAGRTIAVTGGADATLRMWDLTGTPIGEPMTGHSGTVWALATAALSSGRTVAVSGGDDSTVRSWDVTAKILTAQPRIGHTGTVRAVAAAHPSSDRPVAVTGGDDATVRRWDFATGASVGEVMTGHIGAVWTLATTTLSDGRAVAISGGADATLRVWDLTTGVPIGEPMTGHSGAVWALATTTLPDGRTVAVSSGADATLRVWDLNTGTAIGTPMTGHTGPVWALATTTLPSGRGVAVTGGDDSTVRVWDIAAGALIGAPMTGHTGAVWALAITSPPDGRTVAVSGGADATLRVWDLNTGAPAGEPMTGHSGAVWALATTSLPNGRTVAVSGGADATVRLWDLVSRRSLAGPLPTLAAVRSLAVHPHQRSTGVVTGNGGLVASASLSAA